MPTAGSLSGSEAFSKFDPWVNPRLLGKNAITMNGAERIVITGMGVVAPIGIGVEAFKIGRAHV